MKYLALSLALLTAVPSTLAASSTEQTEAATSKPKTSVPVTVSYDEKYDVGATSLDAVSCSNGLNGLQTKGYTTFASVPGFPSIGGAPPVEGWNSPNCGKCYELTFTSETAGIDETIYVTAVDAAPNGFNIGLQAMDRLTKGQAKQLGRVTAQYAEVEKKFCGFE